MTQNQHHKAMNHGAISSEGVLEPRQVDVRIQGYGVALLTILFITATGCATNPKAAVESGKAQLIGGTISASQREITGLLAHKNERINVSTYASECRNGNGTLDIEYRGDNGKGYYSGRISNVILSGSSPADQIFAQLCRDGVPMANSAYEQEQRRQSNLTPEEREAERRDSEEKSLFLKQLLWRELNR